MHELAGIYTNYPWGDLDADAPLWNKIIWAQDNSGVFLHGSDDDGEAEAIFLAWDPDTFDSDYSMTLPVYNPVLPDNLSPSTSGPINSSGWTIKVKRQRGNRSIISVSK